MDHSKHSTLTRQEINQTNLGGAPIYGVDDYKIGTISHVHGAGAVTDIVIDVGEFLGLVSKPVLVSVDQLNLMRDVHGQVHGVTAWTREHLLALPEHRH